MIHFLASIYGLQTGINCATIIRTSGYMTLACRLVRILGTVILTHF
jgi:hypothetical protein